MADKRCDYVYNTDGSSDEDMFENESYDYDNSVGHYDEHELQKDYKLNGKKRKPTREPKCLSRNAVMARQNRIRKKMYLENLEKQISKLKNEVKILKSITNNQSQVITDYRKEVKYLKSVIANSSEISKVLRKLKSDTAVQTNNENTSDPSTNVYYRSYPTPDSPNNNGYSMDFKFDFSANLSELEIPCLSSFDLDNNWPLIEEPTKTKPVERSHTLEEHNYNSKIDLESDIDDAGICLHISKQKMSLEFCARCHEKATELHQADAI